jgi:hypothetical protein
MFVMTLITEKVWYIQSLRKRNAKVNSALGGSEYVRFPFYSIMIYLRTYRAKMKRISILTAGVLLATASWAQKDHFPMGQITLPELDMKVYEKDTAAGAVVLREFGEAYISDDGDNNLIFEYHAKIKILKRSGFEKADFSIPLYKGEGSRVEKWISVKASTYNLNNTSLVETKLDPKNVFKENRSENWDVMKFTMPDIRIGSIIDVKYVIESPFIFNFRNWNFQSDIPKMYSEYWPKIPANYIYNTTLRGYLDLSKNESTLIKNGFAPGGGVSSDVAFYKYAMQYVPALEEEEFMTAKSNFIAAINYELMEVRTFDGRTIKYTREWKDVEEELRTHPDFGAQIRKAKNLFDDKLPLLLAGETDERSKALKIYHFVSSMFHWNGNYSKYAELGIRKAYETEKGNIGDINLTLIAIFQEAGFDANPVLLSTRENGLPNTLHPVLSDFDYVVARIKVGDQFFLVDASDPYLPFGILPERCLNGKGRLITKNNADWVDLTAKGKRKQHTTLKLTLGDDGTLRGNVEMQSFDYGAAARRKTIYGFDDQKEYLEDLKKRWVNAEISNYEVVDLNDPEKPLVEKMNIELKSFGTDNADILFIDPYLTGKWDGNPLKSPTRLFPVDFGAPREILLLVSIDYSGAFEVDEFPKSAALMLPQGGGKFLFSATNPGGKISIASNLQINKSVYTPGEYPALRELINRFIAQQSVIAIKRKK